MKKTATEIVKTIFIGIDPGQANGFAIRKDGELRLYTLKLYEVFEELNSLVGLRKQVVVYIENPNLWTKFKKDDNAKARAQGAGNVKGTYSHIVAYLKAVGFDFVPVMPNKYRNAFGEAKNRGLFEQATGYTKPCSTHARDAAMLIVVPCYRNGDVFNVDPKSKDWVQVEI